MREPIQIAPADVERSQRIRQIVEDCIDRRAAGEKISDETLLAAHRDLMPGLGKALNDLRLVQEAQIKAKHLPIDGLHIRCPHCQQPVEVVEESAALSDLVCPSCGSQFRLTDDSEQTFQASPDEMVNHFRLLEKVGVGAFGSVWRARDKQLDRTVALKIPRKGQMGPEDQDELIREAQAAAQLKHPGIVRVLEVGNYKDRIYIAYDFIEGLNLAEWLVDQRAAPREVAELCAAVAEALQHAHERGVIHRDLKPSNIMLDATGVPHLMDFGLAKREAAEITMTLDGRLLGTPAYMSPEQARGAAHDADARSDVYSLGVMMYELLTGERPFRGNTRMLLHQVLMDDPARPKKLNHGVPRDLETICLKCLEKAPGNRYQTAGELRNDLKRFLSGEPVRARPITGPVRAWRWCKRNPLVSGLAATVACLLIFVAAAGVSVAVSQQRLAAAAKESESQSQRRLAQQYLHRGRAVCDAGYVAQGLHWFARALDAIPAKDERLRSSIVDNLAAWSSLPIAPTAIFHHKYGISNIGYSPDGTKIVTLTFGGEAKLWSARTGELLHELQRHSEGEFSFVFSPDGSRLLTAGNGPIARLWSVETGELLAALEHENADAVTGVAFNSDGSLLVTVAPDSMRLWSGETFELISRTEVNQSNDACARFSSDGSLSLTNDDHGLTRIWSVEKCEPIGNRVKRGRPSAREFSPNGRLLVTGSSSGELEMWSTQNGQRLWRQRHYDGILHVTFDPQGKFVLSTSSDGAARIWSAKNGEAQTVPLQHGCPVLAGAFDPDSESFATVDQHAFIRLWSTKTGKLLTYPARFDSYAHHAFTHIAFRPDGKRLAVSPCGLVAFELDCSDLQPLTASRHLDYPAESRSGTFGIGISPDGKQAITGQWSGTLRLWSLETGQALGAPLEYGRIWGLTVSPVQAYTIVECGFSADTMRVVSMDNDQLEEQHVLAKAKGPMVFSPDGCLVATGGVGKTPHVWSTATWKEVSPPLSSAWAKMVPAAFSPDGQWIAFLNEDGIVRFWSRDTGQFGGPSLRHPQAEAIAMSPDGSQVATGGSDKQVIIWDFVTRKPTGIVLAHHGPVTNLAYTPDGKRILTATHDGDVYMWSASTGERIGPPIVERDTGAAVAFGRHGNRLLIGNSSGAELWEFRAQNVNPIENPHAWVRAVTGRKMNSSGALDWLDRRTWMAYRQQVAK